MGATLRTLIAIGLMLFGWSLIAAALADYLLSFLGIIERGEGHQWAILIGLILSAYQTYHRFYVPFIKSALAQKLAGRYGPVFHKFSSLTSSAYNKVTPVVEYIFYFSVITFAVGSLWGTLGQGSVFTMLLFIFTLSIVLLAASFLNSVKFTALLALTYFMATAESPAAFILNAAINLSAGLQSLISDNLPTLVLMAIALFAAPHLLASKTIVHERSGGQDVTGRNITHRTVYNLFDKDLYKGIQGIIVLFLLLGIVISGFRVLTYGANIILLPLAAVLLYLDYHATRSNSASYAVSGKIRGFVVSTIGLRET